MTREEAIRHLNTYSTTNGSGQTSQAQHEEAKRIGIKALEQESVLDKIRAEIEKKYGDYDICEWCVDYDYEDNNVSEYRLVGKVSDILAIIDKYIAETKGQRALLGLHADIISADEFVIPLAESEDKE